MGRDDWRKVSQAATELDRGRDRVYEYLRRPEVETGIRRMTVGQTLLVHMPTLADYVATLKPGRPRKAEREETQHGNRMARPARD